MKAIHIIRKPANGTIADVVLAYKVGGLNIDACRIPVSIQDQDAIKRVGGWARTDYIRPQRDRSVYGGGKGIREEGTFGEGMVYHDGGRWPANVILNGTAETLDRQSGITVSQGGPISQSGSSWKCANQSETYERIQDSGGASRFFKQV